MRVVSVNPGYYEYLRTYPCLPALHATGDDISKVEGRDYRRFEDRLSSTMGHLIRLAVD